MDQTAQAPKQVGLTNDEAIKYSIIKIKLFRTIIDGLKDLLNQRERNFRDHTQKCKKKTIVALKRIFHPFTLLALAYTAGLIYNTKRLYEEDSVWDIQFDQTEKTSQKTQHIITIIVILALVILDVYLKIQRLNFRVFNIDAKIQQLIEKFESHKSIDCLSIHDPLLATDMDHHHMFYNQAYEKEFSYYQNCFTWTLRNGTWRKIPNNTLATGDIIKLLPGDSSPALVKYFQESKGLSGIGIAKTPQMNPQEPKFFGKGQKIILTGLDEILKKVEQISGAPEIDDPSEAFERNKKLYKIFEVQMTPCIQDLTEYINNMEVRKNFSKKLLYFSNIQTAEKVLDIFQAIGWISCVAINIAFLLYELSVEYFDKNVYMPLIGFSFVVPQIFSICEAWANALIITLFNSLQFDDYNKKMTGSQNFYKLLKKHPTEKSTLANASIHLDRPWRQKSKSKKSSCSWECLVKCFKCNHKSHSKKHQRREKRRQRKKEKWEQMMTGFIKTDSFYENYDFQNRGIRKNWTKFWEYVRSGSNHLNNIFAALSSVSIFAFVDKEGIISETGKYVDEIGVIDQKEEKMVFDLIHDSNVNKEEEIYSFENAKVYKDNLSLLKVLGASFMLAKNPKETDAETSLKEIFTKDPSISEAIKGEIGYYFHNALKAETEAHQDCVCALAKHIGHTDASFHNYKLISSIWNIKKNTEIDTHKKKAKGKDKNNRSFDDGHGKEKEQRGGSMVDIRSNSDDDMDKRSLRSIRSEQNESFRAKAIFADQKNLKKMQLERTHKFGHMITTFVQDKSNGSYQAFSRGEAKIIFNSCSDYWNGEKVMPINKKVKNHIKDILFQWEASDFVTIGFSYKPITPDIKAFIDNKYLSIPYKNRDIFDTFQRNQIFLGIIGIKHHKKQEANKLFQSLDDAGIRGVLFSKEGVLETKAFAKDLGIDSEWNAWISLAENPSDFTKLYNEDGHLILPYGIDGIKKHISEVDKIPLQVPMFCDTTAETTREMFEIYQENGDVVACIGNIINSENLHIFQQANVAIGMMIEPQFKCYRCNGRINQKQQRSNAFGTQSPLSNSEYQPSKLERLSAAINALACTFVFDANTNIYCFFSVFREARRLRESVEQASLMALSFYFIVFLLTFIDLVLGLYNYCDQLETQYTLFVFVPVLSFTCLSRPTKNSVMKRHVLSPKYLQYLDFAVFMIKACILKVICSVFMLYAIRIFYFREAIDHFRLTKPNDYIKAFHSDSADSGAILDQFNYILYGNYQSLKVNYQYWALTFEQEHKWNFCYLLVMLIYLSIGLESPNYSLFFKFTRNKIFRWMLVLQVAFVIAYYLLSTMVFFGPDYPSTDYQEWNYYYPSYKIWLCALASIIIIALIEELTKTKVRELYDRDHNRLKIFFSTKLGMWSPR